MSVAENLFKEAQASEKEKKFEEAFNLYLGAADLGFVPAYSCVGYAYVHGEGTEKNYEKAVEYFRKGEKENNAFCISNLGLCYSKGLGVAQDKRKALEYYKRAADMGHEQAKKNYESLKKELGNGNSTTGTGGFGSFNEEFKQFFGGGTQNPPVDSSTPQVDTGVGGLGFSNWNSPVSKPATSGYVTKLKRRVYGNYIFCYICAAICALLLLLPARFPWLFSPDANPAMTAVLSLLLVATLYPGLGGIIATGGLVKRVKFMNSLAQRGLLEKAAYEMFAGKAVAFGDKALMTENFLFRKNKRGFVIPMEDVLWFYTGKTSRYCDFYIGTRYLGVMAFSGISRYTKNFDQVVNAYAQRLQQRTNGLLINNTPQNKAEFKRRRQKL